MNLKGLLHRELGEGLTEDHLAESIGVPRQTIDDLLSNKELKDAELWKKFAAYFRVDVDFLKTGGTVKPPIMMTVAERDRPVQIEVRMIPLFTWEELEELKTGKAGLRARGAKALIEATDVRGQHTFAVRVRDSSMHPLFLEGELIFVDPDIRPVPGDYVLVARHEGEKKTVSLRQFKKIGKHSVLHPLNRNHPDVPVTKFQRVYGKVVRLRKNF